MKLVCVTYPTYFVEEDKILTALFDEGLEDLHLCKSDDSSLYAERLLSLLPEKYHSRITVHDNYYLKQEFNLCGIHISDPAVLPPDGYKGRITRSCNELSMLKILKKNAHYVILDDVDKRSETELEAASRAGLIDKHVYASGQFETDDIRTLRRLGFGGVVVRDALWSKFDRLKEGDFDGLLAHFAKLRSAVK